MIRTEIILKIEQNSPICHQSNGLAKNVEVARWMFKILGWKGNGDFPGLSYEIERIQLPKTDQNVPTKTAALWSLGYKIILN